MRAQRPQPGNRFVSFVRASGRARARREISYGYLDDFAKRTFLLRLRLRAGGFFTFATQKALKTEENKAFWQCLNNFHHKN